MPADGGGSKLCISKLFILGPYTGWSIDFYSVASDTRVMPGSGARGQNL